MSAPPRSFDLRLPGLRLEAGVELDPLVMRGWWWGPEDDGRRLEATVPTRPVAADEGGRAVRRSRAELDAVPRAAGPGLSEGALPTILCIHALTGDARVGGVGGWWEPVTGPGQPLDPERHRILCFNNLGSCYGSSGPGDAGFPTLAEVPGDPVTASKGDFDLPEASLPAPLTTWDQARAILLALDALGVERVDLCAGGSVGGMVALALGALAPERFGHLVPIATLDRATPWIIGWNHVGRQVIVESLRHGTDPRRTLALARQVAHMTYRAGPGLMERHGRRLAGGGDWSARAPYAVQTYLEHQGAKLVSRFDPLAYVSMLDAMDHHDLGRAPPPPGAAESWASVSPWPGLARVQARIDAVAIDSDELFFARDVHDLVVRHRLHGHEATWELLKSPHGHDAFLMTWDPLRALLRRAVQRLTPETPA